MGRTSDGRTRMLATASMLFAERGIAGTPLMEIIERGGAARGSIYHFFPGGKAQLAREATERAGREVAATLSEIAVRDGPVAAVHGFLDLYRDRLLRSGFAVGCPVAAAALECGEAPEVAIAAGESFAAWEAALGTALWQHGVARARAEALATLVVGAVEGAVLLARTQRGADPLERVRGELVRLVVAELRG